MTCQVIRTAPGPRVTVEFKRGLDDSLTVVALEDALGQANAWSALRPSAAANSTDVWNWRDEAFGLLPKNWST
jgi:hypothetical protein